MDRFIILLLILGTIAALFGAGIYGAILASHDSWSPKNYVAEKGDCFVPPQGDPLYDAHYAKDVNVPNCQAFVNQAQAKNIDEQTRAKKIETNTGIFGVSVVSVVMVSVVLLIVFMLIKGGGVGVA